MLSKREIRQQALERRGQVSDHPRRSSAILNRIVSLPEFAAASTVLWYISARGEVATRSAIEERLSAGGSVVVPYCHEDHLRLCRVSHVAELAPGRYGILEPRADLRVDPARRVTPAEIDLVIVPGVAFDRRGTRLGYGKGYYDKLLSQLPATTRLVAPAFDCQIFDQLPCEPHDVRMHRLVTETTIHDARE